MNFKFQEKNNLRQANANDITTTYVRQKKIGNSGMRTQAVVVQGKLTCSRFPPHAIAILSKESVFKPVILASMRQLESDRRVLKFSPDRRHQT